MSLVFAEFGRLFGVSEAGSFPNDVVDNRRQAEGGDR
jgi:hypothetical protein